MSNLEFFKKQAKNLLKDWQTQVKTVEEDGFFSYSYSPKFFDVGDLFFYYEFSDEDEQNIILARAQHLIAQMVGFNKWTDLVHASEKELEYAEILLRHFWDSSDIADWENTEMFSGIARFDLDTKIEYAKQYFEHINDSVEGKIVSEPQILSGVQRIEALKEGASIFGGFTMNTIVTCIHCDRKFFFKEAKAVKYPDDEEPFVMCKYYPECNGSLIDLMPPPPEGYEDEDSDETDSDE